jgi:pyruvate formate lyase activating enzyme
MVDCPGNRELACIGCGACVLVCPSNARKLVEKTREREVTVEIDGKSFRVPERITVKEALILTDHKSAALPGESGLLSACGIGACWSCAVEVGGTVKPACNTVVREKMIVRTELPKGYIPKRMVMFFSGQAGIPQIEAVCFTVGCNFMCPQCNNWFVTYNGKADALTPQEAAQRLTKTKETIKSNRMLITGGECTLNRPWLIRYIEELKKLNPSPKASFLVDTNGSLLTCSYIDELVVAGVTDISIDLKGMRLDIFRGITGLDDESLAERYKETAWEAVRYIAHNYRGTVSLSVSIPYNNVLISHNELKLMGRMLFQIDPLINVGVVSYNGAFRAKEMQPPTYQEMKKAHSIVKRSGLKNVFANTTQGFIQPSGDLLRTQGC